MDSDNLSPQKAVSGAPSRSGKPPQPRLRSKNPKFPDKLVVSLVGLALLVVVLVGGYFGYRAYGGSGPDAQFDRVALAVKQQELAGARNYAQINSMISGLTSNLEKNAFSAPNSSNAKTAAADTASLQQLVEQSCSQESADLTAANISQKMHGLTLDASQRRYVSDMEKITSGLANTEFSNAGACRDGETIIGMLAAAKSLLPAISILSSYNPATVTKAELTELGSASKVQFTNEASLRELTPQTLVFFKQLKEIYADFYQYSLAYQRHDARSSKQYAAKIQSLSGELNTSGDSVGREMDNLDKTENQAAVAASKVEIAAIDYQKQHRTANTNLQLDPALPSFRIADAAISSYSDAHDNAYPAGSSAAAIANLDSNMKFLAGKGLLKNISYRSLGSDSSGFKLAVKLADGQTLSEELDAS